MTVSTFIDLMIGFGIVLACICLISWGLSYRGGVK